MQSDDLGLVERIREAARDIRNDGTPSQVGLTDEECETVAAAIERLVADRDAALLNERVCVARLETLTTCGLAEVALSNATVMRQWGELTAERDEARRHVSGKEMAAKAYYENYRDEETRAIAAEAQRDKLKEALEQIRDGLRSDGCVWIDRGDGGRELGPGVQDFISATLGDT